MIMKKFTDGSVVTDYKAVAYTEGFEEACLEDTIIAWAHLIETGMCYSLQGWFGRTASQLIEQGLISTDGKINWDMLPA